MVRYIGNGDFTPPRRGALRIVNTPNRAARAAQRLGQVYNAARFFTSTPVRQVFNYGLRQYRASQNVRGQSLRNTERVAGRAATATVQIGNSQATAVVTSKKRKGRRKSKAVRMPKRMRQSIKRMVMKHKDLLHMKNAVILQQVASAVNTVQWEIIQQADTSEMNSRLEYKTVGNDNANAVTRTENLDLTAAGVGYMGKTFTFVDNEQWHMKNNTNSGIDLRIYVLVAQQYTSTSPIQDIIDNCVAQYADTGYNLNADLNQYWTVPGTWNTKRKFKIYCIHRMDLAGGQEAKVNIHVPNVTYNPGTHFELGNTTYTKGSYVILVRQVGKISHDATTPTLLGIANTQLDIKRSRLIKTYMTTSNVVAPYREIDVEGASAITPIVADAEAPSIGPFENT